MTRQVNSADTRDNARVRRTAISQVLQPVMCR